MYRDVHAKLTGSRMPYSRTLSAVFERSTRPGCQIPQPIKLQETIFTPNHTPSRYRDAGAVLIFFFSLYFTFPFFLFSYTTFFLTEKV